MKFVKRITALFLALTMVMAMGITAFAADATYTISTKSDDTHTYSVYQIFTGRLSDGVLSDIVAGQNYKGSDAAGDAEKIAALTSSGQTLADAIAAYVDFTGNAYGTVSASSSLTGVPAGYYLIKDNGASDMTSDSYSTSIVEVVNDVTIDPKKDVPTFEKKVDDINDTTGKAENLQDSADYDIGDDVPFTLKGTVPTNYDSYSTYYYQFTDQMEKSLTFDKNSVKVYVDNTEITAGFTVSDGSAISSDDSFNEGTSFTVTFENLKNVTSVKAGSTITVKYNAKLNDNAVLGKQGNINEAKLTYSNNPNKGGEGDKGETPWDTVIVFTYKTIVNKVDQSQKALGGAAFELFKKGTDGTWKSVKVLGATKSTTTDATTGAEKTTYTADGKNATTFEFSGLDDGDYKLVEVVTPDGYNTTSDIEFTITASHKTEWKNGEDRTTILTELKGGKLGNGSVDTGAITTSVENRKGSTLPSTGGMGTTILYVAGIAMILAAGIVVIARKRNA